jgi:propanediol dehydratase large subunit
VVAAARQWLDAYYRQDKAAMAALSTENVTLADERRPDERLPSGLADVKRTLDRPSVQIAAETAVLTAVMTEQSATLPVPRVSPVAQVWVLSGGQWKVRQARFVSEARLKQVFP